MPRETHNVKLLWLGIVAALLSAVYRVMDNYTVHNLVVGPKGVTTAFAYLVIGACTAAIVIPVLTLIFGRFLDPHFKGFVWGNRHMHWNAFISGFFAAGSTLFLLWGTQYGDPGALAALTTPTIVFTGLYEILWARTLSMRAAVLPILAATVGSFCGAWNGSFGATLTGFVLVFVVSNIIGAAGEIRETNGVKAVNAMNLMVWRFIWLAVTATATALAVSFLSGQLEALQTQIHRSLTPASVSFIVVTFGFVFGGIGLKLVLKRDHAVSVILIVMSLQVFITSGAAWFGNWYYPGTFGDTAYPWWVWPIRLTGLILLTWGVYRVSKVRSTE
ncbi:hypothetical protein K8R03_01830 [Candidatus Kaiserbacteria bacterium]|nr:hypothetical protein [Candidatus Kaiserbacteria bacterium]